MYWHAALPRPAMLITKGEKHTTSMDFLHCLADFPNSYMAVMALLVNSMFDHQPIINLKSKMSKTNFCFIFLALDSKLTAQLHEQAGSSRVLEELCGKYKTNPTKVHMAILNNMALFSTDIFMVYIANVCAYF